MQGGLVTVSDKWQVVIPKRARERMELEQKEKAIVYPVGERKLVIQLVGKDPIKEAYGMLKKYDKDGKAFERMLKQKREDLAYEDRKRK